MKYAKIAVSEVTFWVDRPYDYSVPTSMEDAIAPGMRVTVPFGKGNRRSEGIVLSVSAQSDYDAPKSIQALLDEQPVLTPEQIRLALWMRERFFCTVYEAVKAILPAGLWFTGNGKRRATDKQSEFASLAISGEEALALAEQKGNRAKMQGSVLRLLATVGTAAVSDIRALTGAGRPSIAALAGEGALCFEYREVFRRPEYRRAEKADSLPHLTAEQENAYAGLAELCDREKAGPTAPPEGLTLVRYQILGAV